MDVLLYSCLFYTFESTTSQVLPPQNVSLRWTNGFWPLLSWTPPPHSVENCLYKVERRVTNNTYEVEKFCPKEPSWSHYTVMKGRYLYLSVKTLCNNTQSEPFELNITYPELVRNLKCYIHSSNLTSCSWLPVSDAPDFSFFYTLVDTNVSNDDSDKPLQECSAYSYTEDGRRTGCDLQADIKDDIHILFNGTLNNRTVRNTFTSELKSNVKPLPLKWTVIKAGDKFKISWIPPDFGSLSDWKFTIKRTACNETTFFDRIDTSTELNVVPHCEQCLAIKVERKVTGGESEWSDKECFGPDNALVYAAIIIPLMFAVLAALTFVCCKKNRDIIFPKVPEPRDFLSEISDNNNKITVRNLCIPAEEDCKITLVIDPLNNKLLS